MFYVSLYIYTHTHAQHKIVPHSGHSVAATHVYVSVHGVRRYAVHQSYREGSIILASGHVTGLDVILQSVAGVPGGSGAEAGQRTRHKQARMPKTLCPSLG